MLTDLQCRKAIAKDRAYKLAEAINTFAKIARPGAFKGDAGHPAAGRSRFLDFRENSIMPSGYVIILIHKIGYQANSHRKPELI